MSRQEDCTAYWGLNRNQMNAVKDSKLHLELASLLSWPKFTSNEEDLALCDNTKWLRYNGTRPIFWDMSNVSAVQFSNSDLQRATYSDYYGENCWKGGVGIQLCGWLVVALL